MKLMVISDTHNQISKLDLKPADLLIIAGDLTTRGTAEELIKLNKDLFDIKDKYRLGILAIPGNHDWLCETEWTKAKELCPNIKYFIHHESITIEGIKFFGSGYTPRFCDWAFNVDRGLAIAVKWQDIPYDTDVLITHGPCYGILDEADIFSGHLGDVDLLEAVLKRSSIQTIIAGHIHEGYGIKEFMGKTFINASSCNRKYQPNNLPIEIEI